MARRPPATSIPLTVLRVRDLLAAGVGGTHAREVSVGAPSAGPARQLPVAVAAHNHPSLRATGLDRPARFRGRGSDGGFGAHRLSRLRTAQSPACD